MRLTDQEYNLLDEIARKSKMDCWFLIRTTKSGDDYVYDLENSKRMSLRTGVAQLIEGIDGMYDEFLVGKEYDILLGLLLRLI